MYLTIRQTYLMEQLKKLQYVRKDQLYRLAAGEFGIAEKIV